MCSTPRSPISGRCASAGLSVIVAGWSDGSRERLSHVLAEHGLKSLELVSSYHQAKTARAGALPLAVIALEQGFEAPDLRHHRRAGHSRRPAGAPVEAQAPRAGRARRGLRADRRRSRRPYRSRRRPLRRLEDDRGGGRAARLPRDPLRRRRPAVPAGREPRTAVALRLGDGRARPARRRRLADAQGAAEEARARNGGRTDPRRRPAHDPRRAAPHAARGALRRILRPLSL